MTMHVDSSKIESTRSPARRYHRASAAVAKGVLLFPGQADPTTRLLARLLRLQSISSTSRRDAKLTARAPGLVEALSLYRDEVGEVAHRLELGVLARLNEEEVAAGAGVGVKTCKAYHHCFFDVYRRIDDVDYILHHAIWPELDRWPDPPLGRMRCTAKLFAYFCSLDAVEQLFISGHVSAQSPWRDPLRLIRQLVNAAELSQLADLQRVRDMWLERDPQRFAKWVEQLRTQVREGITRRLPEDLTQRHEWQGREGRAKYVESV